MEELRKMEKRFHCSRFGSLFDIWRLKFCPTSERWLQRLDGMFDNFRGISSIYYMYIVYACIYREIYYFYLHLCDSLNNVSLVRFKNC